jgi:hypothetical protein
MRHRTAIAGIAAALTVLGGAACTGWAPSDSSKAVTDAALSAGATTRLTIDITRNTPQRNTRRLRFRCPAAAPARRAGALGVICDEVLRAPSRYFDPYVDPECRGGLPMIELRVTGVVHGRRVDLRQSGMCGPAGIYEWCRLLDSVRLV